MNGKKINGVITWIQTAIIMVDFSKFLGEILIYGDFGSV